MRSTFHGLEAMKRALYTQQTALNTVSHNVANANTPGYSRQVVDMSAFHPLQYPAMSRGTEAGQLGQGSWVDAIRRMRDQFLDKQFRNENRSLGEWEVKRQTLDRIGAIIDEPSDEGLSTAINEFFKSWHDVSDPAKAATAKSVIRQNAITLVDTFHHMANNLTTLDGDLTEAINKKTAEVNTFLDQVNELNKKIAMIESLGDNANDLRDQRDMLVDQISKMVDITVTETPGGYTIQTTTGAPVALLNSSTGTVTPLDPAVHTISGGEIKGLLDSKVTVQKYLTQLDKLAEAIATEVNNLHNPPGSDIFAGPFTAAGIQVDPAIIASESNIKTGPSGDPGDNSIALAIADLINKKINFPAGGTIANGTFEDYFQAMIGQFGVEQRHAENMENNQSAIVRQIDNQRKSISDVSLDEEMANMIKFQQAYNAAARVVTTLDSIYDKVINGMGLTR